MPTFKNASLVLNLTYTSTQPAANAVYNDANGIQYTFLVVRGTGVTANYAVTVIGYNNLGPVAGTLTKVSGTGDSTVTLNSWVNNPVAIVGLTRIEPGQTVATNEWLLSLPFGVLQTSTTPFSDPTIYSVKLTSTTTVSVPSTCIDSSTGNTVPLLGNYKVVVYADTGEADVQLNSSSAVTCLIPEGRAKEWTCLSRTIDNLIVTLTSTGIAYCTIEKI